MNGSVSLLLSHSRYYARKTLNLLCQQSEFDRVATKVLSSQLYSKASQAIENLKTKVRPSV